MRANVVATAKGAEGSENTVESGQVLVPLDPYKTSNFSP
jgi:hypothetical protein